MSTNIKLKRSSVQGKVPLTTDLELGELAINTYDGKLYMKKNDGTDSIVDITAAVTPTLDSVTLAGNTTTNDITVGNITVGTSSGVSTFGGTDGEYKIVFEGSAAPRQNYIGMTGYDNLVIAADEDNLGPDSYVEIRVDASPVITFNGGGNIDIGSSTQTSGNQILNIYGYDTAATAAKYGRLFVDSAGSFTIAAQDTYLLLTAGNYIQSSVPHNFTSTILFSGDTNLYRASANNLKTDDSFSVASNFYVNSATNTADPVRISRISPTSNQVGMSFNVSGVHERWFGVGTDANPYWATDANLTGGSKIWHAGNDGASSGLDADLLDGQHGSYYTDYTDTAIANLIDTAPTTLDTLNELAAALGDDPNFATTVTNSIGTKVAKAGDTMTGNLNFGDNVKAVFGNSSDLSIYHDDLLGRSVIRETGNGSLYLQGDGSVEITSANNGNIMAQFVSSGAVSLRYNGSTKFATTTNGVDVTGTVTADGLTVDGNPVISGAAPQLFFQTGVTHYNWKIAAQDSANAAFEISSGAQDADATNDTYTKRLLVEQSGDISFYEDTGTTAKFFWDASAEALGIGTTSPNSPLDINTSTSGTQIRLTYPSVRTWNVGVQSGGQFAVRDANAAADRMVITTAGNVGIGASSPQSNLHLRNSSDDASILAIDHLSGGNSYGGYISSIGSGTNQGLIFGRKYNSTFTEAMRLDASGNVLIGTTNNTTSTAGFKWRQDLSRLITVADGGSSASFGRLTSDGDIVLFQKDGTTVGSIASVGGSDIKVVLSSDNDQFIIGNSTSNYMAFSTANAERMRINASGDISMTGTLSGSINSALTGFFVPQNPEGQHIKSPFFFNDIAFARLRGSTVTLDVDGTTTTNASTFDSMFDTSGSFFSQSTTGVSTITITITSSPKTLTYGSYMGITFGNSNWRANSIELQYTTDSGSTWTTASSTTSNSTDFYVAYFGLGAGVSATGFRWVLSNFNTSSIRIASLFAYNYNSGGMKDLYFSRDGGSVYGDMSVNGNIAVTGTVDGVDIASFKSSYDSHNHDDRYYTETESDAKYLLNTTDTLNGILTINTTNDAQLLLTSADSYTGIGFNDGAAASTEYLWHNGTNGTFSLGGSGSNVSGKKLHVHGGMTIGSSLAATAMHSTNGLEVEGTIKAPNLQLSSATPTIYFNGTSDGGDGASSDMAIKATPEGLDFYEPEDGNKIHFQILDDTGVNAPFGYKVGSNYVIDSNTNILGANGNFSGSVVIDGDLTVNGNTITISATELAIEDNLIYLNEGSTVTNPDIGIVGNYNDGTYAHTGVFRDATDGRWKFFKGYVPEPGQTIDTANATFQYADVQANTFYGALSGNASTATTLQTARTIALSGDVTGSASFNGSANITITATVANDSHTHDTRYVRKDGVDNGSVDIVVNDADFVVRDTTDSTTNYIWRDHSASKLYLGTSAAVTNFRSNIEANADGSQNIGSDSTRFGNIRVGTASGGYIYRGWKVGASYADGTAIYGAVLDNATGTASYLFDGYSGGTSGTKTFHVRGDGQGYFAGYVGIGTTSPAQKLHVSAGHILTSNNYDYRSFDTGGNERTLVRINSSNELEYGWSGAGPVKFMGGGSYTERMRIHTDGNVGIGTSSPSAVLHVKNNDAVIILEDANNGAGGTAYRPHQEFWANGTRVGSIGMTDSSNLEIIADNYNSASINFDTGGAERMRINSSGNVGINTTTPGQKLEIVGTSTTTLNTQYPIAAFTATSGGTPASNSGQVLIGAYYDNTDSTLRRGYIQAQNPNGGVSKLLLNPNGGNVGIGTENPEYGTLQVYGDMAIGGDGTDAILRFIEGTNGWTIRHVAVGNRLAMSNVLGGTDHFNISEVGNVSIGSTTEFTTGGTAKLTVAGGNFAFGASNSDMLYLRRESAGDFTLQTYNSGNTGELRLQPYGGYVGIGTTTPGTPLDVNGTARATQFRLASTGVIDDATATTTATTQVAIDAFSATAYGGSKVIIEAKTGVNRHITELLVTHDGTTAVATEYGAVYTSGVLATYDVDISGGNVRILATPASSTSTSYKVMRTTMFA